MSRGNKHTFFVMDIEIVKDLKINIGMQSYAKEAIEKFVEDVSRGVTSPATSWLFNVPEGAYIFSEEKAATFHSKLVKLLWVIYRSRPDIETTIYFLCNQVKDLDIHDWVKLRRLLQFLSQTIGDNHVIGADNIYDF